MIGDGTRIGEVKKIISDNRFDEFVTFSGIIPQTKGPSYLATCDVLVSPHVPNIDGTPFFGSPTKLFEYMSMAKGIVASDLDQIGEILEHNKTALLVKPGNVIELASGIKKLILDKNLRDELGINARNKIIESYSWEIHTKKIFNRLTELI
jgi:glycosyltransferase involved in cell wall biosynthesis